MKLDRVIAVRNSKTVYRDGEDCIKVFDKDYSKADVLNEALNQARIEETGLHIPKIKEVLTIDGKWAIVSEYIKGKTLAQLMAEHPEKKSEYLELLVDLQMQVHAKTCPLLTKLKDKMNRKISAADLEATTRYDLHTRSLTQGPITRNMLLFALPLMCGNLLQQMYNIADTWVVGRFLGADALAAVGSSYTLMTFLTSIVLGLCMGSGAAISMQYGGGEEARMRQSVFQSFALIAGISLAVNLLVYLGLNGILWVLRVPVEIRPLMKQYLVMIFGGIFATFLYNYFANLLRAIGNSMVPLVFLAVSSILNVVLDLVCVLVLHWGVQGAAIATVFSQFVSGVGIGLYTLKQFPELCPRREDCKWDKHNLGTILNLSVMTSVQQSIMNFGILMVQGLVNSFGTVIMAAFAAAVKIDSFAYMPVQDFGNAFSTYVAQNYGANQPERIRKGIRSAAATSAVFCICISVLVCLFAAPLIQIFMDPSQTGIVAAGVHYLHIEGACYLGIGMLFLLYGYYRAVNQPGMSVILTIASLGTRVALAYLLSATPLGVTGIWLSVPIGWALADAIGIGYYFKNKKTKAAA